MSRFDGYTGHLFEEEVLGKCTITHRGYMRWQEAAQLVRKNQPHVMTPVATQLQAELRKKLPGIDVRFYTAVGSTLDKMHSVDGFFEFEGKVTVTIDLTMNPHKDACKADVLVGQGDLSDLPAVAHRVARELQIKLSRRM
jgi:hypothetical protein